MDLSILLHSLPSLQTFSLSAIEYIEGSSMLLNIREVNIKHNKSRNVSLHEANTGFTVPCEVLSYKNPRKPWPPDNPCRYFDSF